VFTSGRLDVYILVPMLWALYNAIPPLLFFVYFFTKGKLLQGLCSFMQVFGTILAAGEDPASYSCMCRSVFQPGCRVRPVSPSSKASLCP
jgi:hypothetical protein